jgi:hypothetical protein
MNEFHSSQLSWNSTPMDFQRQEWDWHRFFLGCAVSFLTPRTLTLRFILSAMIYWGFVPLIETACLQSSVGTIDGRFHFSEAVNSFFGGYSPWLLWLLGYAQSGPSLRPRQSV